MHVNVPQFVDIEDKIAFGLTAKQLLWMGVMAAVLLVVYNIFDRQGFYLISFVVVIIFLAFAFWKPQGVSLMSFSGFMLQYYMKPRSYIWRRIFHTGDLAAQRAAHRSQMKKVEPAAMPKKALTEGQLKRIAWMLDTRK
jgi:hypothetical protein